MKVKLEKHTKGYLMVAAACILWGTTGLLVKPVFIYGVTSKSIVSWKLFFGFAIMFLYISFTNRQLLKIDKKGLVYVSIVGLICQSLYNLFSLSAIEKTSIATAVVLLYTAPVFVTIMSRIFFKEALSGVKIVALSLCTTGCFLAVTGCSMEVLKLNFSGVLLGLGAGFTYALMTIFSKTLLKEYNQWTFTLYILGFGFLFSLPFSNPLVITRIDFNYKIWVSIFFLGLIPTFLGSLLYITGLSYRIESSKAGIIATLEVVVSVIGAYFFFNEIIETWKILGILMVLISILVLQGNELLPAIIKKISISKLCYSLNKIYCRISKRKGGVEL